MSRAGRGPVSPWWAALPPVTTQVPCGEHTHRLRWEEGKLTAADHPDAEGELVLAALGGDRSQCVDLVEAWGRHSDDLEVLAVAPRSAADELALSPHDLTELRAPGGGWVGHGPPALARFRTRPAWPVARMARGMAAYGAPGRRARMIAAMRPPGARLRPVASSRIVAMRRAPMMAASRPAAALRLRRVHDEAERAMARRADLLSLLALGPAFQWRLAATVAAAWADGGSRAGGRDGGRPALVAALAGRLAPAAQDWLGIDPGRVEVALHEDAGWGSLALSGQGSERRLSAALPAGWLASVWAARLAVAGGHLVVAVTEAAWPDATVLGVPEPGADPVILKVRAVGEGWAASGHGRTP